MKQNLPVPLGLVAAALFVGTLLAADGKSPKPSPPPTGPSVYLSTFLASAEDEVLGKKPGGADSAILDCWVAGRLKTCDIDKEGLEPAFKMDVIGVLLTQAHPERKENSEYLPVFLQKMQEVADRLGLSKDQEAARVSEIKKEIGLDD